MIYGLFTIIFIKCLIFISKCDILYTSIYLKGEKKMYSPDIEKTCSLCLHASEIKGVRTHMMCAVRHECIPCDLRDCPDFKYDIFKRPVRHRRQAAKRTYTAADFEL